MSADKHMHSVSFTQGTINIDAGRTTPILSQSQKLRRASSGSSRSIDSYRKAMASQKEFVDKAFREVNRAVPLLKDSRSRSQRSSLSEDEGARSSLNSPRQVQERRLSPPLTPNLS